MSWLVWGAIAFLSFVVVPLLLGAVIHVGMNEG